MYKHGWEFNSFSFFVWLKYWPTFFVLLWYYIYIPASSFQIRTCLLVQTLIEQKWTETTNKKKNVNNFNLIVDILLHVVFNLKKRKHILLFNFIIFVVYRYFPSFKYMFCCLISGLFSFSSLYRKTFQLFLYLSNINHDLFPSELLHIDYIICIFRV
jgi:hypothetical protein